MQLDSPIRSDYDYARTVWDYDTNLYSDEPWLDAGGTLDQTLNNLQNFTSNKLQKQTVSTHATDCFVNSELPVHVILH